MLATKTRGAVRTARAVERVLPSVARGIVLNGRDGPFRFYPGSPADLVWREGLEPLCRNTSFLKLPAIAPGSWLPFEAAGKRFVGVVAADIPAIQAWTAAAGRRRRCCAAMSPPSSPRSASRSRPCLCRQEGANMVYDPKQSTDFDALVQTAIREGKDGRAEIVRQLCVLPLERLASVPPSALALIGPEGLAALAARRAEFAGLAPKPRPMPGSVPMAAMTTPVRSTRRWVLSPAVGLCAGIVLAALSFDRLAAIAVPPTAAGPLSRNASDWPRCLRLDRHTDGCVYRTGGNRLSLPRAAALLRMDAGDLAGLNRHLARNGEQPLPAGSLIVVLRDRARLSGRPS
jgi:hypothetical protein